MNIVNKNCYKKELIIGIAFTVYFIMALNKLTYASLSFNETNEYYSSKYLFGIDIFTWPKKIPIYNLVLFIWLNIFDNEWWFRLFGVIMGFIGALGLYKAINIVYSFKLAAVSVFIYSATYQILYYIQECQSYNMMLALISWLLYFYFKLLVKFRKKSLLLFSITCFFAVWCRTECIFPVFIMYSTLIWKVFSENTVMELIHKIHNNYVIYIFNIFVAVISTFIAFSNFKWEMLNNVKQITFENNSLIHDIWLKLVQVIQYDFSFFSDAANSIYIIAFAVIILFLEVVCILKCDASIPKYIIIFNSITWFAYYSCIKLQLYGSNSFADKGSLFFIPFWIALVLTISIESLKYIIIIVNKCKGNMTANSLKGILLGGSVVLLFSYCVDGWSLIQKNWKKEDIRGAVEQWYKLEAYEDDTLVYYAAMNGFAYYLTHHESYKNINTEHIVNQSWIRDGETTTYIDYFNQIYGDNYPDSLYIIASHFGADLDVMLNVFTDRGYTQYKIYDKDGGKLYYLQR